MLDWLLRQFEVPLVPVTGGPPTWFEDLLIGILHSTVEIFD